MYYCTILYMYCTVHYHNFLKTTRFHYLLILVFAYELGAIVPTRRMLKRTHDEAFDELSSEEFCSRYDLEESVLKRIACSAELRQSDWPLIKTLISIKMKEVSSFQYIFNHIFCC